MEASRRVGLLAYLIGPALAIFLVAPHLADELWYDEAFTLLHYSNEGPLEALTNYEHPNNHVLFSALLAIWRGWTEGAERPIFALRCLPLIFYVFSLPLLFQIVARRAGEAAGLLAIGLFIGCHVSSEFAVQLRGYGPSWLPLMLAWWAFDRLEDESRAPFWALAIGASAVAIGIVPSNGLGVLVVASPLIWSRWASGDRKALLQAGLGLGASVLAGAVFYLGLMGDFVRTAGRFESLVRPSEVLQDLGLSVLRDAWPLHLLLILAMIPGLRSSRAESRRAAIILLSLLFGTLLAVLGLPTTPFSRVFVPFLPIFFGAMALLWPALVEGLFKTLNERQRWGLLAAALCLILGLALWRERAEPAPQPVGADAKAQSIYNHYFHRDFAPSDFVEALLELGKQRPLLVIMDDSDIWALLACWRAEFDSQAVLFHLAPGASLPSELEALRKQRLLVYASRSEGGAKALESQLRGGPGGAMQCLIDSGFFKLWAPRSN